MFAPVKLPVLLFSSPCAAGVSGEPAQREAVCDVSRRNARAAAATVSSMSSALVARQTWQAASGEDGSRAPAWRMAAPNARVRSESAVPQARRHVGPLPVTVASARVVDRAAEPLAQAHAEFVQPVHAAAPEQFKRRARGGERVRVRAPRLAAAARRDEAVDQVAAAGQRSDRVAVRHRFTEHREVGCHAGDCLVDAEVMAERGLPLVKHEERLVPRRELTYLLEDCAPGRRARVAVEVRRHDDCRDLAAVPGKGGTRAGVADAGRQDPAPAGRRARHLDRAAEDFVAAGDERYLFRRWQPRDDLLRQLYLGPLKPDAGPAAAGRGERGKTTR